MSNADRITTSLDAAAPPEDLTSAAQALWWLAKGGLRTGPAWSRAHAICQEGEGRRDHDRVHGLAHWIEGDLGNSDYWYRRAGDRRQGADPGAEWSRLAAEIAG
ncbi:MAG: hypothetical protein H6896_04100 [Rhodovulum sp.]|nr:hypothetical protein [Paracoccaceae bacterium]MCC0066200.1 hypothetical protein [Rhodovulum sp.]